MAFQTLAQDLTVPSLEEWQVRLNHVAANVPPGARMQLTVQYRDWFQIAYQGLVNTANNKFRAGDFDFQAWPEFPDTIAFLEPENNLVRIRVVQANPLPVWVILIGALFVLVILWSIVTWVLTGELPGIPTIPDIRFPELIPPGVKQGIGAIIGLVALVVLLPPVLRFLGPRGDSS